MFHHCPTPARPLPALARHPSQKSKESNPPRSATIDPERQMLGEVEVIGRDRWEEIRRRAGEGASIRAIARALDLDRKTVRRFIEGPSIGFPAHAGMPRSFRIAPPALRVHPRFCGWVCKLLIPWGLLTQHESSTTLTPTDAPRW